jgi:hypothetical protein
MSHTQYLLRNNFSLSQFHGRTFSTSEIVHCHKCQFVRLYKTIFLHFLKDFERKKIKKTVGGWIKKGGATPDRSKTPVRGPLFGPNVLPKVKTEESKNKKNINRRVID